MTTRFLLLPALATGFAGCAPPPPLAFVDLEAVAGALGRDEVMQQQVGELSRSLSDRLVEATERLREQLQSEKDALGENATEEELARFDQLLEDANRRISAGRRQAIARASRYRQTVLAEFRQEVQAAAGAVAAGRGVRVVLAGDAALLWAEDALDITDEVIATLRAAPRESGAAPPARPAQASGQDRAAGDPQ